MGSGDGDRGILRRPVEGEMASAGRHRDEIDGRMAERGKDADGIVIAGVAVMQEIDHERPPEASAPIGSRPVQAQRLDQSAR